MSEEEEFIREIRIDPIVPTESVLISTARSLRPQKKEEPLTRDTREHVDKCPFCRGNEHMTPPAIVNYPNSKEWEIRIVENLYPVLTDDKIGEDVTQGLRQTIDGYGRHEVIIDHDNHGIAIQDMTVKHITAMFTIYLDRMQALYVSDNRLRYVLTFKNFGPAAGATIPHTHSQMIALPVVPENVQAEVEFSQTYFRRNHRCVFCTLIDDAQSFNVTVYDKESGETTRKLDQGLYVIEKGKHFIAIKPFASRFEWEVHILPLTHKADYLQVDKTVLPDLARVIKRTMMRLNVVLGEAQYNYFVHTLPHQIGNADYDKSYHWHIEICPRTSIPSGFELGSGLFVNTVSPERAAQQLRDVKLD